MRKPNGESEYAALEQALAAYHRPIPIDPGFVAEVEEKIRAQAHLQAARSSGQARVGGPSIWKRWQSRDATGDFSLRRALAWGALALLLVFGLSWSIRTLLPEDVRPAGTGLTETTETAQMETDVVATEVPSTPVPYATEPPAQAAGGLNLASSHEEIRGRIIDPTWETVWVQGLVERASPEGDPQVVYVQAWLQRDGAGRVLSSDGMASGLNSYLDVSPRWVWLNDGQDSRLFDVPAGRFDTEAANQNWFDQTAGRVLEVLFPGHLALRSEDMEVVELGEQAGRLALVVNWAHYRLWVDTQTGVVLRQQTLGEDGQVSQDVALSAIAYDLPVPEEALSDQNLAQARFEAPPGEAEASEPTASATYTDPEIGITVQVPPGWKRDETGSPLSFTGPEGTLFLEDLGASRAFTLEQLCAHGRDQPRRTNRRTGGSSLAGIKPA